MSYLILIVLFHGHQKVIWVLNHPFGIYRMTFLKTFIVIFIMHLTIITLCAGKYYAVDAAYTNMPGFMAPFRGARGTQQERAARTLFNRRHASLRGIIERTFDVFKKRFPILKGPMQNYLMATQNNIVLACCALHNFMRDNVPNDAYFVEEENIAAQADNINHVVDQMAGAEPLDMSPQGIAGWNEFRSALANSMYYHQH